MLWALLFSLLLQNDPAFVLPKLDKQVRKHVTDTERKKEILELRKTSEKQRKKYLKDKRKRIKKFDKLNTNRETTQVEFMELFQSMENKQALLQEIEIEQILRVQTLIHPDEWKNMFTELESSFKKHKKQEKKDLRILEKQYGRVIKKINNTVTNDSAKKHITAEAEKLYANLKNYTKVYYSDIANENSIIYQPGFTEPELREAITRVNNVSNQVFLSAIEGHFIVLELTTKNEWDKIMKQIIKL